MVPTRELVAHHLTVTSNDDIISTDGTNFSQLEYSRFKHGDDVIARKYGEQTARLLLRNEQKILQGNRGDEVVLLTYPFKYLPTGAVIMAQHAQNLLNRTLCSTRNRGVSLVPCYKYMDHISEDYYADKGVEGRKESLSNTRISLDEGRLEGKDIILIDDVYITGSLYRWFHNIVSQINPRSITAVFLAKMDENVITKDAPIEDRLNHKGIKTLEEILDIAKTTPFKWNIRAAKYVLKKGGEELNKFLNQIPLHLLEELYYGMLNTEFYLDTVYSEGINVAGLVLDIRTQNSQKGE